MKIVLLPAFKTPLSAVSETVLLPSPNVTPVKLGDFNIPIRNTPASLNVTKLSEVYLALLASL